MKACILGATFNTANMGVSMLAAGAIRCVLHRFPQARIILLDYAHSGYDFDFPFDGRRVPVSFVNIRFSKKVHLANNIALLILLAVVSNLIPSEALRRRLLLKNKSLTELVESDVVFTVAGGDSFSDIYGLGRFLYVALPQVLALLLRKRLICLPQTIGPFKSGMVRAIARQILGNCELILSRDHASIDVVKKLLAGSVREDRLRVCYDMAFDVAPKPPAREGLVGLDDINGDARPLVGYNISGLLLAGGYTKDNMFGLKTDYAELVRRQIEMLIEEKAATVLLIPHVLSPPGSLESDCGACETVFEELRHKHAGKIGVLRGSYAYDEIKHIIGRCDFFVGARMHACIGAISQSIPAVSVAYSDKFAGVMHVIGCEGLVVDPRRMDEGEMLAVLGSAYDRRAQIRSQLAERMGVVKLAIRNALNDVAAAG